MRQRLELVRARAVTAYYRGQQPSQEAGQVLLHPAVRFPAPLSTALHWSVQAAAARQAAGHQDRHPRRQQGEQGGGEGGIAGTNNNSK